LTGQAAVERAVFAGLSVLVMGYPCAVSIPVPATGLIHRIWAMMAMPVRVTAILINSLGERPRLFFDALVPCTRSDV
jgi:hypothetical protein